MTFCFIGYKPFLQANGYDPLTLSFTLGSVSQTFVITYGDMVQPEVAATNQ